jgi:hypothetical protein
MLERCYHLSTAHTPFEMAFIDLAVQRQPHGGRENTPFRLDAVDHGTPSPRRPRPLQLFLKGEAKLVKKHDFQAFAACFLLNAWPGVQAPRPNGGGVAFTGTWQRLLPTKTETGQEAIQVIGMIVNLKSTSNDDLDAAQCPAVGAKACR